MKEVAAWEAGRVGALFAGIGEHLAVEAVLVGAAAGRVWVDEERAPCTAVVWVQHRVFVAGEDVAALHGVVREIAAAAQARGDWGVGVYAAAGMDWEELLPGLAWRRMEREYWEIGVEDWLAGRPGRQAGEQAREEVQMDGLALRAVAAGLASAEGLEGIEQLRAEMCSERVSVEDFLARSFGVCLVDERKRSLAGWCLSEYNCGRRCEVGIEVLEGYRRRGLGTLLTEALCAEAFAQHGMKKVGWHCLAANVASGATARRAGLRLGKKYDGAVVLVRA